jgi:type IX secretion system PorP/SprF family membrane protein
VFTNQKVNFKKETMKNITSIFTLFLLSINLFGQSDPSFRQNQFNVLQLNPAQTGSNEQNELTALSVNSWIGLEGAPKTVTISGNFNVNNRMGIGFTALNDEAGPLRTTRLGISGAYHLPISKRWKVSLGLNGFISNVGVDLPSLSTTVLNDPHMATSLTTGMQLRAGWGLLCYGEKAYFGLSQPIIGNVNFINSEMSNFVQAPSLIAYAGFELDMINSWRLRPNVVYRYVPTFPLYLEMTSMFTYDKKIDIGLSYQVLGSASAILGIKLNDVFYVGYAYSYPTTKLNRVVFNTHEIGIRTTFGRSKKSFDFQNPRFFN